MARQLMIVRHAKSDWGDPALPDHDRLLAPRGEQALPSMAAHVAGLGAPPELVICSTARRAVQTANGVLEGVTGAPTVLYERDVYLAAPQTLIERLQNVDVSVGSVMMVGHNPGLHELAVHLAESDPHDLVTEIWRKFPTGAIATVEFDGEWEDVAPGTGRLTSWFTPRGGPRP